jgi:hypothetical protein
MKFRLPVAILPYDGQEAMSRLCTRLVTGVLSNLSAVPSSMLLHVQFTKLTTLNCSLPYPKLHNLSFFFFFDVLKSVLLALFNGVLTIVVPRNMWEVEIQIHLLLKPPRIFCVQHLVEVTLCRLLALFSRFSCS